MTGKSQAAIIAAALSRAEKAENELQYLIRWLSDLAQTTEKTTMEFCDDDLSVTWSGGGSHFRKGAFAPYAMLQALYRAENWRLTHAELAEILYGDELAPIHGCARNLDRKLNQCRCPLQLLHDSSEYWLSES